MGNSARSLFLLNKDLEHEAASRLKLTPALPDDPKSKDMQPHERKIVKRPLIGQISVSINSGRVKSPEEQVKDDGPKPKIDPAQEF